MMNRMHEDNINGILTYSDKSLKTPINITHTINITETISRYSSNKHCHVPL